MLNQQFINASEYRNIEAEHGVDAALFALSTAVSSKGHVWLRYADEQDPAKGIRASYRDIFAGLTNESGNALVMSPQMLVVEGADIPSARKALLDRLLAPHEAIPENFRDLAADRSVLLVGRLDRSENLLSVTVQP